jgi:predicted RNA-binding Zn-ribbon protein involved in translation (DUF1610 family)
VLKGPEMCKSCLNCLYIHTKYRKHTLPDTGVATNGILREDGNMRSATYPKLSVTSVSSILNSATGTPRIATCGANMAAGYTTDDVPTCGGTHMDQSPMNNQVSLMNGQVSAINGQVSVMNGQVSDRNEWPSRVK